MRRLSLTSLVLFAALHAPSRASAQVDAQIAELNGQALEAYQALDIDTARGKLEQAIGLAQQAGLVGPAVAQTYMNLGVVYVAGMNDRDQGITAFVAALCQQPNAQLDPLLSTPDVQQVFTQAQQDAQSGACGPSGPPAGPMQPMMPPPGMAAQYGAAGPRMDVECPPGVKCDTSGGGDTGPSDFARGFVNLQLVEGLALVRPGMKADSKPADFMSEIYTNMPVRVMSSMDLNGDGMVNENDFTMQDRYVFNSNSAWVPDADSFDDLEVVDQKTMPPQVIVARGTANLSSSCAADGKRSGPIADPSVKDPKTNLPFTTFEPSSYCVRVESPGFVPNLAIRLNPGYFVSERFALSMPVRIQFKAGKGTLSHVLIGARGELLFSKMDKATGVPVSWFFGATFGQIQAKPPPKDPKRASPFVVSGMFGVHTGVNVRIRVHRNFGFIIAPEFDLQLPDMMINVDIAGGVEGAF